MADETSGKTGIEKEKIVRLLEAFNRHGVRYVIIGGWAVILHGFVRTTMDIDLMVEPSPENLERILKALREFSKDESLEELKTLDLTGYGVVRVAPEDFDIFIDLVWKIGPVDFYTAISNAEDAEMNGITVKVAGIDTLIEMKRTVRPKDQMDLAFLMQKKKLLEEKNHG